MTFKDFSKETLISSFIFPWSRISFLFTSGFLTHALTDHFFFFFKFFFEIKEKLSWLFSFLVPLTFASNFYTLSYSLINKFKVLFIFIYSLKFASEFKWGPSSLFFFLIHIDFFLCFMRFFWDRWLQIYEFVLKLFHFIWSFCSDSAAAV